MYPGLKNTVSQKLQSNFISEFRLLRSKFIMFYHSPRAIEKSANYMAQLSSLWINHYVTGERDVTVHSPSRQYSVHTKWLFSKVLSRIDEHRFRRDLFFNLEQIFIHSLQRLTFILYK